MRDFNKLLSAILHNKLIDLTTLEKAIPTLIAQDQVVYLGREVNEDDITLILFSLKENKITDLEGSNATFFSKTLGVLLGRVP